MSKDFIFVFNSQDEIKTPFSVKLLGKLGDEIGQKIFSGKYYVQSEVSRESFQTFLDYLYDKKENPELTVDNYYEFQVLSEEFNGNLREYLSKKEFENIKSLSILKHSTTEVKGDVSSCEEYIAKNLDYFLENYSKEMREMRTTTLYNIFKHEKRQLKNHERAYEFIKEVVKSGKESNCVLLKTLEGIEMSEKSIEEAFCNIEKNYGFLPEFNLSFISDIKSQMNTIMNQQIQMMNSINSMLNEKINSIQGNYLLLSQKIDESNNKIENLSQKVEKIIEGNGNTKEKIVNLSQKIEESSNETANLSQKIGNIESKVNETFTKSAENSRDINDIKEKVELIKRKNSEIETKCDNTHSCVLQNEKSHSMIFNAVCQCLKISLNANNGQFNGIIRQLTNECGGNVSDKGIVNVTMSSTCWGNPRDVVNLENTGLFGTCHEQDSWIKYDFKNKKVSPVCYSIRSVDYDKNWHHPKSWVVEGSNTDSNDWKVLDSRTDCMSLNNRSTVQCFAIQQSSDFYRFLRIRQTDKTWGGNYYLTMSTLEYFGFIQ
ncbi:hypothetical protein M9Y10_040167 [Tritrichomonas musculus]|uniref:F5/8 type C domain-containing protein n=1 Tax=Tritrichomonas musculus TaxID=1915356 RepID=A0ABR2GRV9_9EUKA